MRFREIITIYCENHTKDINVLCGQNADCNLCIQLPLRSSVSTVTRLNWRTGTPGRGKRYSLLTASKMALDTPSLLSNWYRWIFPRG
jgi:hypothetical protein